MTAAPTPVHLPVKVPETFGPRVRLSHLRVDESHGDAYTLWVSQGMPANPSADEVTALRRAMDPSPLVPDATVTVPAGGSIGVDFALPRFGISLVTIVPASQATDGGDGCACHAEGEGTGIRGAESAALTGTVAMLLASLVTGRRKRR